MLVMSRKRDESVIIDHFGERCLLRVAKLLHQRGQVAAVLTRIAAEKPDLLDIQTIELEIDQPFHIDMDREIVLLDMRGEYARIGVNVPQSDVVHRLEVYEALRRHQRRDEDGEGDLPGSPVPRNPMPRPPTLNVRLDEPRSDD